MASRNKSYYKVRYGVTPQYVRHIFFGRQEQRCKLCEDNLEFGAQTCYDKPTDSVVCKRCKLALNSIRSLFCGAGLLERALKMAKGSNEQ